MTDAPYFIKKKGRIPMVYSEDVRKRFDTILEAFENCIDGQDYFDIVYSKKIGYVWIVVDEPSTAGAEQLNTPEAMLDSLFNDIINDVIAPRESTSLTEAHSLTEREEAECRRRITAILETIKDGAGEHLDYLDSYLKDYQKRYHEDGE